MTQFMYTYRTYYIYILVIFYYYTTLLRLEGLQSPFIYIQLSRLKLSFCLSVHITMTQSVSLSLLIVFVLDLNYTTWVTLPYSNSIMCTPLDSPLLLSMCHKHCKTELNKTEQSQCSNSKSRIIPVNWQFYVIKRVLDQYNQQIIDFFGMVSWFIC